MGKLRTGLLVGAGAALLLAAASSTLIGPVFLGAFGLAPSYQARDHDPYLTAVAAEAKPIIGALDAFRARNGACPPAGSDLQNLLPPEVTVSPAGDTFLVRGELLRWSYAVSPEGPGGCSLRRKLGWDPSLSWRRAATGDAWVFDPGDGSAGRTIVLDP
jgi:hypothetical protein